jgi:hypothetical protein
MFLLAAKEIIIKYPFSRFMIIGDGDLRPHLEELAGR